jgi:hypothetical protein
MRFLLFVQSLLWTMSDVIRLHKGDMEKKALQWTVATVDDEDDIEMVVEGIPGYITAGTSKNALSITEPVTEAMLDTHQPTRTPHQPAHRHVHPRGATAAPPRTCAGVGPSSAWTPHGS